MYFCFSSFGSIRCMGDIHHLVNAEEVPNRPGRGLPTVGHAEHVTNFRDNVLPFKDKGKDRRARHESLHFGIERLLGDVRVMLPQKCGGQTHHLAAADGKTRVFKTSKNLTAETLCYSIRFEENQCALHKSEKNGKKQGK